jgi:hypothetical protein
LGGEKWERKTARIQSSINTQPYVAESERWPFSLDVEVVTDQWSASSSRRASGTAWSASRADSQRSPIFSNADNPSADSKNYLITNGVE